MEKNTERVGTRQRRKVSESQINKSAVTDHVNIHNHVINWDEVKIKDSDSNERKRGIREAIAIRRNRHTMNRDEGRYILSHTYDQILRDRRGPGFKPSRDRSARHLPSQ